MRTHPTSGDPVARTREDRLATIVDAAVRAPRKVPRALESASALRTVGERPERIGPLRPR